jgi:hypothetical protein
MLSDDDSIDDDSSYDIDQLVQYLAEPRHPSLSIGDLPIAYWTGNSSHWPKLTSMALDIFAVPAISVMILTLHVARLGAPRYVYHLPHLHSFNNQASTSLTISDVLERVFTTADDVLSPRRRFLVEQWTVSPNSLLLSYGCLPMVALCYLLLHIGEEHALYIYHDLVSLAGQVIHPSIHSFIL